MTRAMTTTQEPAHDADALVAETRAHRDHNRVRPGVDRRAETGAAARRAHRRRVPEDLRGQEVREGRAPSELKACHAFLDAGDALLSSPRSTATADNPKLRITELEPEAEK